MSRTEERSKSSGLGKVLFLLSEQYLGGLKAWRAVIGHGLTLPGWRASGRPEVRIKDHIWEAWPRSEI